MSKPTIVNVATDSLLERMAKAGYEEVVRRTEHLRDSSGRTWETETEALREDWRAIARAIQHSSGKRGSNLWATASGDRGGVRRFVIPFVANAMVVALLAVALWAMEWGGLQDLPGVHRASPAMAKAETIEPGARRPAAEAAAQPGTGPATAHTYEVPAQEFTVPSLPSQGEAGNNTSAAERPEPRKTACAVDLDPWPIDSIGQAKAIQILLRDLGFYGGTTYGTVGPATRAAIRQFQLAADETETGEPSKMLFESLKRKKCASPAP